MRIGLMAVAVAGLLCAACAPSSEGGAVAEAGPIPVIVDYSPTVSDVGALMYLLAHSDVEVIAVSLPVTGEAGCELGAEVTLRILAMFDSDAPVACDPEVPVGAKSWPGEFLAGQRNLLVGLPDPISAPSELTAPDLISRAASDSGRPVILLAVAPLTNVARALDRYPDLTDQLDRIVIMGGAVDTPGNVADTDAEWNFWIDVAAAARVLDSEAAITLVPLDATNHVPVPGFWERDLREAEQTESIKYLNRLVRSFPAVTSGFFYLWDELAASVAAGEDVVTTEPLNLIVVEELGAEYGSTVHDQSGGRVTVATSVPDPAGFYAHFLTTLAGATVSTQAPLLFDKATVPTSVNTSSSPEEVLAFWLVQGVAGDVPGAASVVAPDADWVGFFASPDVFAEGSGPYASFDIEIVCSSEETQALCDMTWNDLWIAAIPELERGELRVRAEVVNGTITAFREFGVGGGVVASFNTHLAWLEAEHPTRLEETCAADVNPTECSLLLISTVEDWVASR